MRVLSASLIVGAVFGETPFACGSVSPLISLSLVGEAEISWEGDDGPWIVTIVSSKAVLLSGQGSWYRRHGRELVGWGMMSGRFARLAPLKEVVSTDHVREDSLDSGREGGRWRRTDWEEEKTVKPVSLGEAVTPRKNWNLSMTLVRFASPLKV